MDPSNKYDVGVIGGGLAGLSLAIQCAKEGHHVILFEKERYPFHKVCGEYISLESWDFLEKLDLPLSQMDLPIIKDLEVSSPGGRLLIHKLPLGGFGISRYKIDGMLAEIAVNAGVVLMEDTKVFNIEFHNNEFVIQAGGKEFRVKVAVGSFGKRSNLDIKWHRPFAMKKDGRLNNFVAVKYHVKTDWPVSKIALHNFSDGYCGISSTEDQKNCLCYLTTAENLLKSNNSIVEMEKNILCRNPHLKKIFTESEKLYEQPLAISQVSFDYKSQVEDHVLMVGDAAGMITPLCGNGMSMALHGSKIAAALIHDFLINDITRTEMEEQYKRTWSREFSNRLRTGRIVQRFFGNAILSNILIGTLKPFPSLVNSIVRSTHGRPF